MNIGWKEIAGDMLKSKLKDIYSQKPVPDEKDKTMESYSKQKMMSWWTGQNLVYAEYKSRNWNPAL